MKINQNAIVDESFPNSDALNTRFNAFTHALLHDIVQRCEFQRRHRLYDDVTLRDAIQELRAARNALNLLYQRYA